MKKNKVLILYYHRINVLEEDYNLLCVSPIKFKQQMLYLKQNYQIVRFEDDWDALNTDAVVITFDDGYLDNLQNALPILEETGVPATIFISTGSMSQTRELWWDELEQVLLIGDSFPKVFQLSDDEFNCNWDTDTYEYRKNCYYSIHYLMKNYIDPDRREVWLRQLWDWRGLDRMVREDYRTMSEKDCRKLAESKLITVGAHTISHSSLANLSKNLQENEIKLSIEKLAQVINQKITMFSYPFGNPGIDFDDSTISICQKYGIMKAASTEFRLWDSSFGSYKIPRKIVRDWTLEEFKQKIIEYWNE